MKRLIPLTLILALPGCNMGALLQAPATASSITRAPLDFALNSFDAALSGLDFAMDSGRLTPGSETARKIAAAGRKVMNFLGVAEAARDLGSSATYEQAFANAKTALDEFRGLFPTHAGVSFVMPLTNAERQQILARLEGSSLI